MTLALIFTIIIGTLTSGFFYFLAKLKGQAEKFQHEVEFLREEKESLTQKNELQQNRILHFEKSNELLKQNQENLEKQKADWTKDKETILFQLSEDLMKRNSEQQHKININQQESIKKVTENLFKDFENVTAKVMSLNDEVKKSSDAVNLTQQALLNPGSAGRTAEITLENILKNSGLKERSNLNSIGDYVLQSHFSGVNASSSQEAKRPDAVLFFPGDQIAIIDSKSSPHFLDLQLVRQEEDKEQEKIVLAKIKEAFRKHLDNLSKKAYSKFLFEDLCTKNPTDYKIITVMFVQTERMLETLREIDPHFEQKAIEAGIIVASPIGLINFLSQARIVIDRIKQEKNVESLKISVRKLLDNIAVIFKESEDLGKSLNKSLNVHNKMTKTLNRSVYSTIKNIAELGIEGKKSDKIKMLEEYEEKDD